MEHFTIDVPRETLDGLRYRLKRMHLAERHHSFQRRTQIPASGHFGAMKPEALVDEIPAFFRTLRILS
jgi:hypothetical protein